MGHYVACRRYGVRSTLPYFLPGLPLLIGTFGAVIRIRGPIPSRKALFDIAAAGPIAGFAVALPVLAIGVALARPLPATLDPHGPVLGPPLISWIFERLLHGDADLHVGSVYGAAWVGMLVTSLNLLPVGQLDGGHAVFALSPYRHRVVSWLTIAAFVVFVAGLAIVAHTASSYILWLGILFILRDRHPRLLDETTPLDRRRAAVAVGLALMLILTFIPIPLQFL
jgi:membrane-associated protease RseP (regulator of RpoE activity)